eukprot:Amastigsp_a2760_116.p4 type:complete len:117 gc:universal Amastigsp_a2760_116:451-801(+)
MMPPIDETAMSRPEPCCRMCGSTACVTRNTPKKFTSMTSCSAASLVSSRVPRSPAPALLTTTSIRPYAAIVSATHRSTLLASVTSMARTSTLTPFAAAAARSMSLLLRFRIVATVA